MKENANERECEERKNAAQQTVKRVTVQKKRHEKEGIIKSQMDPVNYEEKENSEKRRAKVLENN